jgi:hypothetical protein
MTVVMDESRATMAAISAAALQVRETLARGNITILMIHVLLKARQDVLISGTGPIVDGKLTWLVKCTETQTECSKCKRPVSREEFRQRITEQKGIVE